ncbi:hypothetical protein AK88_05365 [Plasmodium fragile]|uniref:Schizont-infected cell agglutination extracellular alpha domain-containing protein n=1 Tax=Plasmodium fragile TaxID=5857 RepID=A0A0D9QD70_PLAFR|nr:uncharacterized protein AK88_05365 [Plasmodium fragile]KJP85010.1 hypothetical protein AK88_05365 [Plasmodium fragile]
MVWNKTKDVMKEFVEHMQDENIISYASNCGHAGWKHPTDPNGQIYVGHKVGDKIVCVLMVGALLFMNGWHRAEQVRPKEDETNESIRRHLRCAIVHMFSAVLNESVCKSQWATFYAWHIMQEFEKDDAFKGGSIKKGKCGRNIFSNVQIRELDLNADVKAWLGKNSKLEEAIQKIKGNTLCTDRWRKEWSLEEILGHGNIDDSPRSTIAQIMHGLQHPMTEIFKDIGKQAEQTIQQRAQAKTGKSANDGKNGQAATNGATPPPKVPAAEKDNGKASTTSPSGEGVGRTDPPKKPEPPPPKKPEAPPVKVPEQPKVTIPDSKEDNKKADTPSSPSSAGRNDPSTGADGTQPQAPASPVLPARPPPPPPPSTPSTPTPGPQGGAEEAGKDGAQGPPGQAGSGTGQAGTGSTGNIGCQGSEGTSSSVSVSCGTYTGPGLEAPNIPAGITVTVPDATSGPEKPNVE